MKRYFLHPSLHATRSNRRFVFTSLVVCIGLAVFGCRTPEKHREKADAVADKIIKTKQQEALGKTEPLSIERPSDILRRRLIEEQGLPISSEASLGTDQLEPIPHWPDEEYPPQVSSVDANIPIDPNQPLRISLIDALQIGARNSPDYQAQKERVFQVALGLDLTRNAFRTVFTFQADGSLTRTVVTGDDTTALAGGGAVGVTRTLKNGLDISAAIALDLVKLIPGAYGEDVTIDQSVSIPLLRGAGRHIVTEPLIQAERDVIYQMWNFERYKRTFAVDVARQYLNVLQQADQVNNAEDNYRRAVTSARRSRRHADAGRLDQVELDQALQNELSARNGWISAQEQLRSALDLFKRTLGLPTDARVELDRRDLDELVAPALKQVEQVVQEGSRDANEATPPADAPVVLVPATREGAGPYELDEPTAVSLALENRLDLHIANGGVYDAQRLVVVAADALRATLNVGADVRLVANDDDGTLGFERREYSGRIITFDVPIDPRSRVRERNDYRNSLINLEQATRNVQDVEDRIKLDVREGLRTLLENRETLKIQVRAVAVAKRRVRMTDLLLEAGRAQMRDVLDAQAALLSAQNSLTRAVVQYRVAELELQRDMDVLQVNEKGLWQELSPEEIGNDI